jgi:Co/Zn/Cd efflux system component
MARCDRTIKRLAIALAVVSLIALISNIFCIYMLKTSEEEKTNEAIIVCEDK